MPQRAARQKESQLVGLEGPHHPSPPAYQNSLVSFTGATLGHSLFCAALPKTHTSANARRSIEAPMRDRSLVVTMNAVAGGLSRCDRISTWFVVAHLTQSIVTRRQTSARRAANARGDW